MENSLKKFTLLLIVGLSGCVTQTFENDKTTPVIQNESSHQEIAMTRISLGLGYLKMGNTTQAKLNLEKAKRVAPQMVQVHTAFAHYYDTVGEPKLAIQAYEKALSIKSDDADTLNNYGVFLCKQEQYEAAEKQMLRAIAVPTYLNVAKSYENLALCQLNANAFDKAEHYLDKSIQHSPSNASAILNMMRLQYAKAKYKVAEQYLKRYEKATRRFEPEALALAYKIYSKQGNTHLAKNYAAMLVKMFPNSLQSRQYLLNELAVIEADTLAEKYIAATKPLKRPTKKKRVVKLSPNNHSKASKNDSKVIPSNSDSHSAVTTPETKMLTTPKEVETGNTQKELATHTVVKGDTLYSISMQYNIQMKALERWNNISRRKPIKIGDKLLLANPKD